MAAAVPCLADRSVDRSAGRSSAACARRAPQRSRRQARTHPLRDSRRLACEARRISTDVLGRESPELSRDAARGFAPRGTRLRRAAGDARRARRPAVDAPDKPSTNFSILAPNSRQSGRGSSGLRRLTAVSRRRASAATTPPNLAQPCGKRLRKAKNLGAGKRRDSSGPGVFETAAFNRSATPPGARQG
jgi:hypothetical protein